LNPFYFGSSKEPLFGAYHPPVAHGARESAVLLCPPIAQEYIITHWSYRRLADMLSNKGFHVLRFDYFGTGDSAGHIHNVTVERWHENIKTAAYELIELSGCRSLSVVGLRTGAALASTTKGLVIQDFFLWDTIISGARYMQTINQIENNKLLEFPFSTTVQNAIKQINLLSDFSIAAKNIFIFSSGIIIELEQLKKVLRADNTNVIVKNFDDSGEWDQPSNAYHTFLPNVIPKAIVNALTRRDY